MPSLKQIQTRAESESCSKSSDGRGHITRIQTEIVLCKHQLKKYNLNETGGGCVYPRHRTNTHNDITLINHISQHCGSGPSELIFTENKGK